jgi:hypothetical protein
MLFLVIGVVLILGAVGLFIASCAQTRRRAQIQSTETSTSRQLAERAAGAGGPGSFRQAAEVKGTIECADPLVSELSGTSCIAYTMEVTREYEEQYWHNDQNGNKVQGTRRGTDRVAHAARRVAFAVRDAAGSIAVDPDGAKLVDEEVFSQYRPGDGFGPSFQVGNGSFSLSTFAALGAGRRTIGYRFVERAIPVGRAVYVLGEATDEGGALRVRKPAALGLSFLVSLKSEEQLLQSTGRAAVGLLAGAAVAVAAGAAGVVYGIIRLVAR